MGERFGKYELLRRIAVGGMAEVYMARAHGAQGFVKDVVIKRILPAFTEDADFVEMFINEARLAVKLRHVNLVQILDFDHVDGNYYIAMEWVDGADLRRVQSVSRRRAMPVPRTLAVHVGIEALKGLHYAHTRTELGRDMGVVHRDISPHNLLLSFSGEVKIADFGIAKVAALASATRPGAIKGKLTYMSPEQISGDPIDHRSDLYSLGIVLWELLSGRRAYAEMGSEGELIAAVRRAEIPSLRSIDTDIPEELERVVTRILASSVEQRYESAAAVLPDLSRFACAGDALDVADFLRQLLPAEAEREQRGRTEIAVATSPATAAVVAAAPTQTQRPQPSGQTGPCLPSISDRQQGWAEGGDPSLTDGSSAAQLGTGRVARPESGRRNRTAARISVVATFVLCGLVGWWIADRGLDPKAPPTSSGRLAASGSLTVRSEPLATQLLVDGVPVAAAGRAVVRGPIGARLNIEARCDGRSGRRVVRVGPGRNDVLVPLAEAPPQTPVASLSVAAREPLPSSAEGVPGDGGSFATPKRGKNPRASTSSRSRRSRTVRSTRARNTGTLEVIVSPWAHVELDGRTIGATPIKRYRLASGRHVVRLRNRELGKMETISITVRPDKQLGIRRNWLE